jgi:hypothetical protein
VRGEREGAEDGRHESNKKTYYVKYARGAGGPSGPIRGTMACKRGGPVWWPGLAGLISIGKNSKGFYFQI